MRCAKGILCLLLLICTCQIFCTAEGHISELRVRGSPRGSGSKSPSHSGSGGQRSPPRTIRLFGVDISQSAKRPASPGHTNAATHSHPAHSSASTHAAGSTSGHTRKVELNYPKSLAPPRKRPSKEYKEWAGRLRGSLATGMPGPKIKPVPEQKPQKSGRKKMGRPPGNSGRYEANRKYYQRKKLKKLAEQASNNPSGHHEHPPKGGKEGSGGSPGSPGAGTHAVSKRRVGANGQSDALSGRTD